MILLIWKMLIFCLYVVIDGKVFSSENFFGLCETAWKKDNTFWVSLLINNSF